MIHRLLRKTACVALLCFAPCVAVAISDPLSPELRQWLQDHEPIVFISQTTYPPFEFVDDLGLRRGMSIELAQWIAQEFRFHAEFEDRTFQEAQHALLSGEVDVLTSFFYSEERDQLFDFTHQTWEVPSYIFVRADRPDIVSLSDLRGKRIAMQRGDYAAEFLRHHNIDYQIVPTASFAEAADRVMVGGADAMIGDHPIVLYHLFSRGRQYEMKTAGSPLYIGINGMATKAGRPELIQILNQGIQAARDRGVFEEITESWLGTPMPATAETDPPLAAALVAGGVTIIAIAIVLLAWAFNLRRALAKRDAELLEARDPRKPLARRGSRRGLALRLAILVALLAPLGLIANHLMIQQVIMPGYMELEQQAALQAMNTVADQLRHGAHQLGQSTTLWSQWGQAADMLTAVQENPIPEDALFPKLSEQSGIDLLAFFTTDGTLAWYQIHVPAQGRLVTQEEVFATDPSQTLQSLMRRDLSREVRSGIQATRQGAMFMTASPILRNTADDTARGWMITGRFIQDSTLMQLGSRIGGQLLALTPQRADMDEEQITLYDQLEPGMTRIIHQNEETLSVVRMLPDMKGRPGIMVQLTLPRDVYRNGQRTARLFSFVLLEFILVTFIAMALWFILSFRETMRRQRHIEALVDARTGALKESESKWRGYVTSAPMGILTFDSQGRILEANPAACRMTGRKEEELKHKSMKDLLATESQDAGWTYLGTIIEMGWAVEEMVCLNSLNERRNWMVSGVKLDEDRFLAFAEDITERLAAETEREQLESQLVQVQKMEAVGRLAGGVAHDFNNMLAVIIGNTEMALESMAPDAPLRGELEEIEQAATRSSELTRQLLAFARRQSVNPRVLDLNSTLEGMLKMIQRLIGEDVELCWTPEDSLPPIKMDPSQIDQIVVNLCVNARDAIEGKGTVTIKTGLLSIDALAGARLEGLPCGDYVTLTVQDTGCGMDKETELHLFEPFFTTKQESKGTGLGLATVYGIVKQNRGYIEVDSTLGEGTSFCIYFPALQDDQDGTQAVLIENDANLSQGETILIVEDEPAILNITMGLLSRKGFKVLSALGAEDAEEIAKTHPSSIDLILTDVVMPGMNGKDLAQRLKQYHPNMKHLFMSGHTSETIARHGVSVSSHFIQKPFTSADLEDRIRQVLEENDAESDSSTNNTAESGN